MSGDNLFYAGFVASAAVCSLLVGIAIGSNESKQALKECEKNLPRNEHCVIVAVPVDKN